MPPKGKKQKTEKKSSETVDDFFNQMMHFDEIEKNDSSNHFESHSTYSKRSVSTNGVVISETHKSHSDSTGKEKTLSERQIGDKTLRIEETKVFFC